MKLKIMKIILWPKNDAKPYRSVDFDLNKVNVITGQSETGKSALMRIVDYCLGSSSCAIPVGRIREKTGWFGLLLECEQSQMILARKEPGALMQTSEAYIDEGVSIGVPEYPKANANVEAIKNRLNELANLSSLDFKSVEGDSQSFLAQRASFRDMVSFVFQPQHIVANPLTLFYKADTYENMEKLKTIFPFALGIINSKHLSLSRELKDLTRELKTKRKELEKRKDVANAWLGELKGQYSLAREYGLIQNGPAPAKSWSPNDYIKQLRRATPEVTDSVIVAEGSTERAVSEIIDIKEEERELSHALVTQRAQLSMLEGFASSTSTYRTALEDQRQSLEGIGWFAEAINEDQKCPFCSTANESAKKEIQKLISLDAEIRSSEQVMHKSPNMFDKMIADTKLQLRDLEHNLNVFRDQRRTIEQRRAKLIAERYTRQEIDRFIGRIQQSLENLAVIGDDSDLPNAITKLEARVNSIREQIDQRTISARRKSTLGRLSYLALTYANILKVEHKDCPINLDLANLTARISSKQGKDDFLWQIGGGHNWMSYHVSIMLALQEHFISLDENHVPSFLMFDQPSQAYFPESWPGDRLSGFDGKPDLSDYSDDIKRVRNIFTALAQGVKRTDQNLQIIITEHADQITWADIENVHLVARWRPEDSVCGTALIPSDW